ncbi:hypothetical protein [Pantoea cypripedii]|uniref:hypothetical protein n=1 Tax=Pantoea cypripedii TaxID=55209 RepID=UPI00111C047D|nr:hypothetical protein [Pantoea cypripedii]MBP2198235.1 hypothetical protein [Pantoea cypripedii]
MVSFATSWFRSLPALAVSARQCGDRAKGTWPSPLHSPALRRLPRRFAAFSRDKSRRYTPPFAASLRLILESFPRSASPDGAHTHAATAMTFWGFSVVVCLTARDKSRRYGYIQVFELIDKNCTVFVAARFIAQYPII